MAGDAVKKYRDMFSFGLLAVAILYLISGVSLLAKSEQDSLFDFPGRAAMNGYLFTHPLLIGSLAVAVALAVGLGEASSNARGIIVVALVVGGISLLLGLVSWLAAFGYEGSGFGGVLTAGKVVSILLGLAQLIALGLTVFFAVAAFQTLPKKVPQAQHWGAPGYGQQQWGQPDPSQWGQHAAGAQQWGPPAQQQWGQPQQAEYQQQWGQPAPQQQQWGQPAPDPQQAAPQWGQHAPQPPVQQWEQPAAQPEQYGAQHWGQPEQQSAQQWGQQPEQGWAQPAAEPAAETSGWGQPTGESDVEATTVSENLSSDPDLEDRSDATADQGVDGDADAGHDDADDQASGQQDGWWQRPNS